MMLLKNLAHTKTLENMTGKKKKKLVKHDQVIELTKLYSGYSFESDKQTSIL